MSHNGLSAQTSRLGTSLGAPETGVLPPPVQCSEVETASPKTAAKNYSDLQSAARFPIKLPVSVKSKSGESQTETQNISANGVLLCVDAEMPVGAPLDFTISLPAAVLGAEADVQIDCRGRVVRSVEEGGRRGVGVVIDEYRFERR
jgi:PilZ domain